VKLTFINNLEEGHSAMPSHDRTADRC